MRYLLTLLALLAAPAWSAQFARPASDVSQSGCTGTPGGAGACTFANIDETVADNGDFNRVFCDGSSEGCSANHTVGGYPPSPIPNQLRGTQSTSSVLTRTASKRRISCFRGPAQ